MAPARAGRARNPAAPIFLGPLTLGVYWFIWLYRTVTEVARNEGRQSKAPLWVTALACIWGLSVATAAALSVLIYIAAHRDPEQGAFIGTQAMQEALETIQDAYPWLLPLAGLLSFTFYLVQLVYVQAMSRWTAHAAQSRPGVRPVAPALAPLFSAGLALGQAPLVGGIFSIAGAVLAILWVVGMQRALNAYWAQQPETGGWRQVAPAAPVEPQAAIRKRYQCPDCKTPLTAEYVPGQPTPVTCRHCGAQGIVR